MGDVAIVDEGSVVSFRFENQEAKTWAAENLQTEDWQWLGANTLVVDHRFAEDIVELFKEQGFEVFNE